MNSSKNSRSSSLNRWSWSMGSSSGITHCTLASGVAMKLSGALDLWMELIRGQRVQPLQAFRLLCTEIVVPGKQLIGSPKVGPCLFWTPKSQKIFGHLFRYEAGLRKCNQNL